MNGFSTQKPDSPFKIPQISNFKFNKIPVNAPKSNNFVVPNFTQKTQSDDQMKQKFNSLSELVSSHLKSDGNLNATKNINGLTRSVAGLEIAGKLGETKSMPSVSFKQKNGDISSDWHIDLTKALKTTQSSPILRQTIRKSIIDEKASFEIPFIDCETIERNENNLSCRIDIKSILKRKFSNQKRKSPFCKVLCKKYNMKMTKSVIHENYFINYHKYFNFTEPSPDDQILKYLRK